MHVPVVRQHCAQIEGFAFNHIIATKKTKKNIALTITINGIYVLLFLRTRRRLFSKKITSFMNTKYRFIFATYQALVRGGPFDFWGGGGGGGGVEENVPEHFIYFFPVGKQIFYFTSSEKQFFFSV